RGFESLPAQFIMIINLPNALTLSRLILVIPLLYSIYYNNSFLILTLVSLIILSDLLDGYFARRMNLVSKLGHWLDFFVDQFIGLSVFFGVIYIKNLFNLFFLIFLCTAVINIIILSIFYNLSKFNRVTRLYKGLFTADVICFISLILGFYPIFYFFIYFIFFSIITLSTSLLYLNCF
ncbi:MAG: CDP-alcohol phosphatidyltransferase family protein, partial [Nanoarchaeota archaeon]|nr:CDP-alcohol phosphatidyltransferase family protein [Nanoarchaeota archaeon]